MEKRTIFILAGIIILSALLRLWNIDKPAAVLESEYLSLQTVGLSFPLDFLKAVQTNCYAPLHFLYLKLWGLAFGDSQYILRLSSVVPCTLAVLVMYFAGVEFADGKKSEKNKELIGLICAGFCAISSFLIYFSQEVRIYTLAFLLASLVIWFSLRLYNNRSRQNWVWFWVFSVLLMLEHTISFVFVFFNLVALCVFKFSKGKKKEALPYIYTFLGILILLAPIIPFAFKLTSHTEYLKGWWMPFSWDKVYFFFTDLFSPVVNNFTDRTNFLKTVVDNAIINFSFIIFAIIPTLICLACLFRNFIKPKKIRMYVFCVFLSTFLVILLSSIAGKLVFLTKYSIELYPMLILLVAGGLTSFKSKTAQIVLGTVFCVMSLFFIIAANIAPIEIAALAGY